MRFPWRNSVQDEGCAASTFLHDPAPLSAESSPSEVEAILSATNTSSVVDLCRDRLTELLSDPTLRSATHPARDRAVLLLETVAGRDNAAAANVLGRFLKEMASMEATDVAETGDAVQAAVAGAATDAEAERVHAENETKRKAVLGEIRKTLRANRKARRRGEPPRTLDDTSKAALLRQAEAWLLLGAEGGSPRAMVALGALHTEPHRRAAGDTASGAAWLRRAAEEHGDPEAWHLLASLHYEGALDGASPAEAVRGFRAAADGGFPAAQYFLGYLLHVGYPQGGLAPSREESLRLLATAGENHPEAAYYVAELYRSGASFGPSEPALAPDEEHFRTWLKRACDLGSADAWFAAADDAMHSKGDAVLARKLYSVAAELDHPDALVSLGTLYAQGLGGEQSDESAFRCYERAGTLGSETGWVNVAAMYMTGTGIPKCEQTGKYIMDLVKRGKFASETS